MSPSALDPKRPVLGKPIAISLPHWAISFYAFAAILLLPWTIYISIVLPTRAVSLHWDLAWGGFDVFIVLLLALTAYLIAKHSAWIIITASALGTALLTDAWFDVLTARRGTAQLHAIILAVFVELPVAFLSWYMAGQATAQSLHSQPR